ncbi:ficolin-3-like [Acanthaster planci]|uniref:Ficolin-3-like n=1 Tax=Acanthaster planci TaxID=133434 RepID=A0A8B7Z2G8_ACAPL|nr:ficolin-3-like [Acanthaster planci]
MACLICILGVIPRLIFLSTAVLATGTIDRCTNQRQQVMQAVHNSVLRGSAYNTIIVRFPAVCGRECALDRRCKSFNFSKCHKICELNRGTREEYPEYFAAALGTAYFSEFGEDEDTNLTSSIGSSASFYRSCGELYEAGYHSSGIFAIYAEGLLTSSGLCVYCDMETEGGGWIVLQRRHDSSEDFYRSWNEYRIGFGNLSSNFWLGNDILAKLTANRSWTLRVDLEDWDGHRAWAKYPDFKVSPDLYRLEIGRYDNGSTAGDALSYNRGLPFSTKDRDNDEYNSSHCAVVLHGAWWFGKCGFSHLNGRYYSISEEILFPGIVWYKWKRVVRLSLKSCSIKIRETALHPWG